MDQVFLIQIFRLIVFSDDPLGLKIILIIGVGVWIIIFIFIFRFVWTMGAEAAKYVSTLIFKH